MTSSSAAAFRSTRSLPGTLSQDVFHLLPCCFFQNLLMIYIVYFGVFVGLIPFSFSGVTTLPSGCRRGFELL